MTFMSQFLQESDANYDVCIEVMQTPVEVFNVNNKVFFTLDYPVDERKIPTVYKCRTCRKNSILCIGQYGPNGSLFLQDIPDANLALEPEMRKLRDIALDASVSTAAPTLHLVKQNTFPSVEEGVDVTTGKAWQHLTICPAKTTAPAVADKFELLWRKYGSHMGVRLSKLVHPDAGPSLDIVASAAKKSDNPSHWATTLEWIRGLRHQDKALEAMTHAERICLMVHALMTGTSHGDVHIEFSKSDNILDFILKGESEEAVISLMNARLDVNSYQVRHVTRKMAEHAVTDSITISLSWNTYDDLDLHVHTPSGAIVNYLTKKAGGCVLNFDANAGCHNKEEEPVENVSVIAPHDGEYRIYVNNYENCSHADVPYEVVIMERGKKEVVHQGMWYASQSSNPQNIVTRMNLVCKRTFDHNAAPEPVEMTDKERRRTLVNASLWDKDIGSPISTLATVDDVTQHSTTRTCHVLAKPKVVAVVEDPFFALAASPPPPRRKTYLSDRCAPRTFADVLQQVTAEGAVMELFVRLRDLSPGYMVHIHGLQSPSTVLWDALQSCHYRDQGHPPTTPTTRGNARLSVEWFADLSGVTETSLVRVVAVVLQGGGAPPFLALEGAQLPPRDSRNFPRGAGFYAPALCPAYHVLRDRWGARHTTQEVLMPSSASPCLVGGFATGDVSFYMGPMKQKVTVSCVES